MPHGFTIEHYRSQSTATVVDDDGRDAGVLYSTEPLLTPSGDSIDLTLEAAGADGYRPARGRSPVHLPANGAGPATLTDLGLSLTPVGAAAVQASEREGRLFYPEIYGEAEDVDYVLAPTRAGVEAFWQLRSPAAREEFPPAHRAAERGDGRAARAHGGCVGDRRLA